MALSEYEDLQQQVNKLTQQLQQAQRQLHELQQQLNSTQTGSTRNKKATYETTFPAPSKSKKTFSINQHSALENFIGLKIINLVGIIVLLIGISIGVKYAIDKNLITPLTRIILAYSASAGLYILSLVLRKNYEGFSAILLGCNGLSLFYYIWRFYLL